MGQCNGDRCWEPCTLEIGISSWNWCACGALGGPLDRPSIAPPQGRLDWRSRDPPKCPMLATPMVRAVSCSDADESFDGDFNAHNGLSHGFAMGPVSGALCYGSEQNGK
ncbi:hypothetical protein UY3_14851 [Chelonia mydas]|uniref:Uncharacterized protein n=1 Tax=Chelonia mydas TaxID=8469 RepID=M7BIK9_CHEMY|nr:hypothetical protein UY3_14851 [Chelonia mydas]